MDKKLRNLLILVGILILLCVGYAVVGVVFREEETEAETADPAATDYLFRISEDGLTELSYTYDADGDGEAETWSFTLSAEDKSWRWRDDPNLPLNNAFFTTVDDTLLAVTAVKVLRDVTPERLAEYGLTSPAKTVTFIDAAGGPQWFCLGAYNAYNGTYCATLNGNTSTVYLLDGELYDTFEVALTSLVSYSDLPECKPEQLKSVTFVTGADTVTVTRTPLPAEEGAEAAYGWFRSVNGGEAVPVAKDLADSIDLLLGDMDYLSCMGVSESDFPAYGLDADTTRMTVVYDRLSEGETAETTFTLTLGGRDKYDYYYANPEGTTLTMLLGGSVWYKLMTYDDAHLAEGDAAETAAP